MIVLVAFQVYEGLLNPLDYVCFALIAVLAAQELVCSRISKTALEIIIVIAISIVEVPAGVSHLYFFAVSGLVDKVAGIVDGNADVVDGVLVADGIEVIEEIGCRFLRFVVFVLVSW